MSIATESRHNADGCQLGVKSAGRQGAYLGANYRNAP